MDGRYLTIRHWLCFCSWCSWGLIGTTHTLFCLFLFDFNLHCVLFCSPSGTAVSVVVIHFYASSNSLSITSLFKRCYTNKPALPSGIPLVEFPPCQIGADRISTSCRVLSHCWPWTLTSCKKENSPIPPCLPTWHSCPAWTSMVIFSLDYFLTIWTTFLDASR